MDNDRLDQIAQAMQRIADQVQRIGDMTDKLQAGGTTARQRFLDWRWVRQNGDIYGKMHEPPPGAHEVPRVDITMWGHQPPANKHTAD